MASKGICDAELALGSIAAIVTTAFMASQAQTKLCSLEIKSSDEEEQKILDLLADTDIESALTYCQALSNAINHHRNLKSKDWTVESLEVTLL